jgi:hypothetical protein
MSRQLWLTSEIGVGAALEQAVQLCRSGLRRPWLTLALGVAAPLLLVGFLLFGRREYAPVFVFRVVEAESTAGKGAPPLKRQLADYVRQAVFTSEPLFELMRRHGLYPSLMRRNARAALEAFKEDITVDVYQNYFVEDRSRGKGPRSARLSVSFHAKDPQLALAVTRDLGALIERHEHAARSEQALAAASGAERARDTWVATWQRRSADIVIKQNELERGASTNPRQRVELIGLLGSLGSLEQKVEAAERRAASLNLSAAWERRGIALNFEVVDGGTLPGRAARLQAAVWAGVTTLLCGLPLIAMAVGAFAPDKRGRA